MTAMRKNDGPTAVRVLLVGLLVVAWIATWLALAAAGSHSSGIPTDALLAGLAMCMYAGGLARFAGRPPSRARAGAAAGVAMVASYILGALAIQVLHGLEPIAEGETTFSLLIELPFWLGVPFLVGAGCGLVGWIAVHLVVTAHAKSHAS